MKHWGALACVLLLALGAVRADTSSSAQTIAATSLNDGPYSDANSIATVPPNTGVTIIERQGGWYHVRLPSGQDGWVSMTSLRLGASAVSSTGGGSGWGSFFGLFQSGRSGASGTTATTGVRGLNTGDIQNAQPNPGAVTMLNAWTAKANDARQYAGQLPAKDQQAGYLPKVQP
ncbi:MAG TPA: SH3 domain-containing protein [Gammaproteobacteria bacterium]|nr:SH3 domain-containing protein [Gammaproteobacteria bacterium]